MADTPDQVDGHTLDRAVRLVVGLVKRRSILPVKSFEF
jgi:hypothetical protein